MPLATESEMRARLMASLESSGIVDSLKSQLRNRLINDLRSGSFHDSKAEKPKDLIKRVADTLVADYLKVSAYDYTRSVFLPESMNSTQTLLSAADVTAALGGTSVCKISAEQSADSQGMLVSAYLRLLAVLLPYRASSNITNFGFRTGHNP